jgi:hypothetical protein
MGIIHIGSFMYNYIAQVFLDKRIIIKFGDSPSFNNVTRELEIQEDPNDATIVHESTHILIDGCHLGKSITRGEHEAAAYLAESLWALNSNNDNSIDDIHLRIQCSKLAHKAKEYNSSHSDAYMCDPADIQYIVAILGNLSYDTSKSDVQTPLYNY